MTFDQWHKSEFGFDGNDTLSMGASDNRPYQYEARKKAWNAALAESKEREQAAVEAERERCASSVSQFHNAQNARDGVLIKDVERGIRSLGPTPALDKLLAEARDKSALSALEEFQEAISAGNPTEDEVDAMLCKRIAFLTNRLRAAKEPHA